MQSLYQPVSNALSIPYQPTDETEVTENPPRFTWMPVQLDDVLYRLQVANNPDFDEKHTKLFNQIRYNMFTPSDTLESGTYYWRYSIDDDDYEWSVTRSFHIDDGLPETPLASSPKRYEHIESSHPRLWLNPQGIETFREKLSADPTYCEWHVFYEKSVLIWKDHALIPEPQPYTDGKRTPEEWRKMYIDCQEVLYAVRHLSVAGIILEDEDLISIAKKWLLHIAEWDSSGTTSRDYNDEASFRIAAALAWGYDWLYGQLSNIEKDLVKQAIMIRLTEVINHVMERSRLHITPYDSHGVRALSSVLIPCCIALFGEILQIQEWLDYTLEYFNCLYSPWGDDDGGWAEGPLYWTTGMAVVVDALNLVKNYSGIDLYKRPLFQKTGDFPLNTLSPDTMRMNFGDSSNLGERPLLKTAYLMRQFAAVTGNPHYQWYFDQVSEYDTDPDSKFYNWGWWDFRFDNLMFLSDYTAPKAQAPETQTSLKWFQGVGWVAIHHAMADPENHIMFLIKSSPYGSISHSHGDQNAFLLHAYGEPFAVETGYYVAHNSTFHRNWRRQTLSKNAILIGGNGQYAGTNKVLAANATGNIEIAEARTDYYYVRSDATLAYKHNVEHLTRIVREVYFVKDSYFVIVDHIDLEKPDYLDWMFHSVNEMQISNQQFQITGNKATLDVHFVYNSSGRLEVTQSDDFTDVDPVEYDNLPSHYHLRARTNIASHHRIITLIHPHKKSDKDYVLHFVNDQGFGTFAYFLYEGHTLCIEISRVV